VPAVWREFGSREGQEPAKSRTVIKEVDVATSNSLVLIMDRSIGEIPESFGGSLVASTSSCIAVGTLAEHDGTTRILLNRPGYSGGSEELD